MAVRSFCYHNHRYADLPKFLSDSQAHSLPPRKYPAANVLNATPLLAPLLDARSRLLLLNFLHPHRALLGRLRRDLGLATRACGQGQGSRGDQGPDAGALVACFRSGESGSPCIRSAVCLRWGGIRLSRRGAAVVQERELGCPRRFDWRDSYGRNYGRSDSASRWRGFLYCRVG